MQRGKRDYTVDSVARSLLLLDVLGKSDREMGVLEISKTAKIHISTVYRLLTTLKDRGFVDQNPETEKYRLGIKLFELGMARIRQMDFRKIAVPFLKHLHDELRETVFMGILRGQELLIVESFSVFRGVAFRSEVGAGEPLYCTGIGKALLANLPPTTQDHILREIKLKKFTPNTLTRKTTLREELDLICRRGYSIDNEEIEVGVKCVGAPMLNHEGHALAAFSVAGPAVRIEAGLKEIVPRVLEVSYQISSQMGYVQPMPATATSLQQSSLR